MLWPCRVVCVATFVVLTCKASEAHLSLQDVMSCPSTPATTTLCMQKSQYDEIVHHIVGIMDELKLRPCTNNNCKLADFFGCTLRAVGHDFMDFRSGSGGSDGCLRFEDPDNKGLINCLRRDFELSGDDDRDRFGKTKTLHHVYKKFCDSVSLADFLVIAGEAVMGASATRKRKLMKRFRNEFVYGRTTRSNCADGVALPNPADGCAASQTTFLADDAFGLTWRETAALMGVHTVGKARLENSGYSGWWQDEFNTALFNNNYYITLVNHGWGPAVVEGSGKSQWDRVDFPHDGPDSHHEMMLNTDLCLVYADAMAETSDCCAWERFGELTRQNITDVDLQDGRPIFCGFKEPSRSLPDGGSFGTERDWCCRKGPKADCAKKRQSGNLVPRGPATKAVHEFAADEAQWLKEFVPVWTKVTTKGADGLVALEDSCAPTASEVQLLVATGADTLDSNFWSTKCLEIPNTALYVKVVMGTTTDYFRPSSRRTSESTRINTFCQMLTSSDRHEWSPDHETWHTPSSQGKKHLGGSGSGWPSDGRKWLSFWGSDSRKRRSQGGCCHTTFDDKAAWGRDFTMWYVMGVRRLGATSESHEAILI